MEPANPGLAAVNRTNTRAQVESSRQSTFQQHEYMKFQATNQALRNFILNAKDDKYIKTLKHDITSYANISPFELLTYIWDTYGKIDDADHTLNEQRMKAS